MVKDLEGIVFRLIRQLQDLLECIYSHFLYLTIFYFIFVLYFLWHTNFLFLLGFQLQLTAQFPSSSLHIRTTPPLLSTPTVLFVTHFISTLPMQHTLSFPRGSSSWIALSWRRKHYGHSKRLELLVQRHGVSSRTTWIFCCSETDWRVLGKTREISRDSWRRGRNLTLKSLN